MNIYKNVVPHGLLKHHLSLMLGNKHESIILSSVFIIWIFKSLHLWSIQCDFCYCYCMLCVCVCVCVVESWNPEILMELHFISLFWFSIHSKNVYCLGMSMEKFSVFPAPLSKDSGLFNKKPSTNSQKNAFSKSNQDIRSSTWQ